MPDRAVLEAFGRAVDREAHNLSRWPNVLWQQLYNRLQWEDDERMRRMLEDERRRRSTGNAVPWLWVRTRYPESAALLRTLVHHARRIRAVSIGADGSLLVSGSEDGILEVLDLDAREDPRTIHAHDGAVNACAVSPDGSFIASAGDDRTVKIWDPSTGRLLKTLRHEKNVRACAVSPGGGHVITGTGDGELLLWDPLTWRQRSVAGPYGPWGEVGPCAVSPDGDFIVCAREGAFYQQIDDAPADPTQHDLEVFDPRSGELRFAVAGHTGPVKACAVSPDATLILSASSDRTIRIWDATTGEPVRVLDDIGGPVSACVMSPDKSFIVAATSDRLELRDSSTGDRIATLEGHPSDVAAVAVTPDGALIVSAGVDGAVMVWDAKAALRTAIGAGPARERHSGPVVDCYIGPEGSFFVSASYGQLKVWDPETFAERTTFEKASRSLAVSPEGDYMVSLSDHGIDRWDLTHWTESPLHGVYPHFLRCCSVSPDGAHVVLGGSRTGSRRTGRLHAAVFRTHVHRSESYRVNFVKIVDALTGEELRTFVAHQGTVLACTVSPDGRLMATGSDDATLKIRSYPRGTVRATLDGHAGAVTDCAISRDGTLLVSASRDGTVVLWRVKRAPLLTVRVRKVRTLRGHRGPVNCCTITPDDALIVSGGGDRTVRVWERATGIELATLALPAAVTCIAVHPSRPVLACGDGGGNVHFAEMMEAPLQ